MYLLLQGTLTESYSIYAYYPDINTLKQLDESGYIIRTSSPSMSDIFGNNTDDEVLKSLSSKIEILPTKRKNIQYVAEKRDIASVERYNDASLLERDM